MLSRLFKSKPPESGATSTSKSKTLKITEVEHGFLTLDHDALSSLLLRSDLKGHPIAIIAIAGCLRTGKSFLLNYMLRYLRHEGWKDKNWISRKTEENIEWRTGQEPQTQGIDVWNEIFTVENRSGREVKVLLMDTQGLFDNNTKPENNVKLLMFAALASSVLILNIMKQVQERDLENLNQCVRYAMMSASAKERYFKMQKLMVLIRDWPYPTENAFGLEGGNQYITKVLKPRPSEGSSTLNEVRKFLGESFSQLQCYLMPNPISRMDKMEKFEGKSKELDSGFRKSLRAFCDLQLHPDNITAKQNNGTDMTARDIRNLLTACDKAFGPDGTIQITDLLEATANGHYSAASENAYTLYLENIKDKMPDDQPFFEDSVIDEWHRDSMALALEKYDAVEDMGRKDTREQHRNGLENKCNSWIQDCKDANRIQKEREVLIKARFVEKAFEKYKEDVDSFTVQAVQEHQLREKHGRFTATAIKVFTDDCENINLHSKSTDDLQQQINEYFKKKLEENKEKLEELARIKEEEREMVQARNKFVEEYERIMNDFIKDIPEDDELRKKHRIVSAKVIDDFRGRFPPERRRKFDGDLEKQVEDKYRSIVLRNATKREAARDELKWKAADLAGRLRRETREKMTDRYVTIEAMEEHLEGMEARLVMEMKNMQFPKYLIDQNVDELRRKLQSEARQIKEENERNKPTRTTVVKEVHTRYRDDDDGIFERAGRVVGGAVDTVFGGVARGFKSIFGR